MPWPTSPCSKRNLREQFTRTLKNKQSLGQFIISAVVTCGDSINGSIKDIAPYFWLQKVHTLTTSYFNDVQEPELGNYSHKWTSPVKVLRLIECGAHERPLAAVLSWPQALQELYYDFERWEWNDEHTH